MLFRSFNRLICLIKNIPDGDIIFISHRLFDKAVWERPEKYRFWPYWVADKWAKHGIGNCGVLHGRTVSTIGCGGKE